MKTNNLTTQRRFDGSYFSNSKKHFTVKLWLVALICLSTACSRNEGAEEATPNGKKTNAKEEIAQTASTCTSGCWIGTVNQASNKIELYDRWNTNWNDAAALHWSWKPTTALGYTSTEVGKWGDPNDFKIRTISAWGGDFLASIGNGGLVSICTYPGGVRRWAVDAGNASVSNIHAIEMLPDGCVAVAAPLADWVRVYKSSTGSTASATVSLNDAHAVLWDPLYNCLWAAGANMLRKYAVNTSGSTPTVTLLTTYTIPTNWAHAIGAKYGNTAELYVASQTNVYVFNKATGTFTNAPGSLDIGQVKAISNNPAGVVIRTRPDSAKNPIPSDPSPGASWTTSYVDYFAGDGSGYIASGHKTGAAFYKGFVYNTSYQ